jgi:hypothetical protein
MKKIITLAVLFALLTPCFGIFASAEGFGIATEVIAEGTSLIKAGLYGKRISFSDTDFKSALCKGDIDTVKIESLPSSNDGTLLLSGRRVMEGQEIKRRHLALLEFVPKSREVASSSFEFSADGGEKILCIIKFTDKINYAPEHKSEGESVMKTYESVSLTGRLCAEDPEGDELEYIVVSYPRYGTLSLSEDGRYTYLPRDGYIGRDKFSFVVRDSFGNYTELKKVSLSVYERPTEIEYEDMKERSEYNASLAMTALGVMNGKILGDRYYFNPDERLTRGEFVAMLLKSQGVGAADCGQTFFDDDSDIPRGLVGYIATAQRMNIIGGEFENGRLVFKPNEEITKYECAKIISTLLGGAESGEEEVFMTDDGVPVWARGGVCHMKTLGVFDEDEGGLSEAVTKAEVAEYLYRLIK